MILGKKPIYKQHHREGAPSLGVFLRPLPSSTFCVGQTEPRVKVFAPNTTGEKTFQAPFVTYQIAKNLHRTETKEGRGLRFDEINDRLFANTVILPNALRQRIKQVASYDKNTQIWTTKSIGFEDFPGVEALGRRFSPEGVAAFETSRAAHRRLCDMGMHTLYSGSSSVPSVGAAMVYLTCAVNAARERKSKMSKMVEHAKALKGSTKPTQIALYEMAASKLETVWKELRKKHEVARFIYEELQLAP
uniref:Transcription initiation factor TFIID subunit 1 histone acetyltransferase domain-containing protein n=1 Tax=Ditylum brightwellii TaxID=49249 RepID=A0A7S4SCV8_9STRA